MYTTVCFDLDGTLLNSKKQIEDGSKDAIKYLKQSGVHIVFASARHFSEIIPYVKECGLSNSDYIISCDGQYIMDVDGTLIWENNFLKRKDLLWVYKRVKNEFTVCTDCGDYKFKNETLKQCVKRHIRKPNDADNKKIKVSRFDLWTKKPLNRVEKIIISRRIEDACAAERYTVRSFDHERTEIFCKGVTKYRAIHELCEKGLIQNMDNVLYFGDDYNDIECFENIKACVAMGTAPETIKENACFVTKSCDDHGIEYAIEQLVMNKVKKE